MALHPDDRPKDVTSFVKALTGETTGNLRRFGGGYSRSLQAQIGKTETQLGLLVGGLVFLSLLFTLIHNL
jgi:hypothetical protein